MVVSLYDSIPGYMFRSRIVRAISSQFEQHVAVPDQQMTSQPELMAAVQRLLARVPRPLLNSEVVTFWLLKLVLGSCQLAENVLVDYYTNNQLPSAAVQFNVNLRELLQQQIFTTWNHQVTHVISLGELNAAIQPFPEAQQEQIAIIADMTTVEDVLVIYQLPEVTHTLLLPTLAENTFQSFDDLAGYLRRIRHNASQRDEVMLIRLTRQRQR